MLEDVLEAQEIIVFRSVISGLEYEHETYDELAITNKRIVFYKKTGIVFKKDKSASISLANIQSINFREKGVIRKKGVLEIHLVKSIIPLEGKLSEIKHIYQNLISLIK